MGPSMEVQLRLAQFTQLGYDWRLGTLERETQSRPHEHKPSLPNDNDVNDAEA